MQDISYYWNNKKGRAFLAAQHTEIMGGEYDEQIKESVAQSKIYSEYYPFNDILPLEENFTAELVDLDSVSAIFAQPSDEHIAVLNFASYKNPGGGFLGGSRAQEECLCHESYLYNVLREFPEFYDWNNLHKNNALYTNRAIYSPHILFQTEDVIRYCDVITCAAPNYAPALKYDNGVTYEENLAALDSRIKFVLDIAADQGVHTLILGAYGCGVFRQDATDVCNIFMKYLRTTHKCFKKVIFAIPANVDRTNYNKFQAVLQAQADIHY